MVGTASNVYVSATGPHGPAEGKDEHVHHRSQNTWLISVEPHRHFIPFLPRNKHDPIHFTATKNEGEESYTVSTHETSGIIGAILIAKASHCTDTQVREALEEGLASSTSSTLPSEQAPEGDTDRWLRKGLHVLQAHHIISAFDVGEFFTFAHAYAANRAEHEAPAMITYPGLHD